MAGISKWWYFFHAFFWVLSGLLCYLVYRKNHPKHAKRHFLHSLWLPWAIWVPIALIPTLLLPGEAFDVFIASMRP